MLANLTLLKPKASALSAGVPQNIRREIEHELDAREPPKARDLKRTKYMRGKQKIIERKEARNLK